MLYRCFIKPILFFLNPEFAHNFTFSIIKVFFWIPGFKFILKFYYCVNNKDLEKKIFGLTFKNPVGLAAGFDKNAKLFDELSYFGFGFIEIGTVTPLPQVGNSKPRLFRLPKDEALINRMGFNNDGIDLVVARLKKRYTNIIIGGNIGKNKITSNELAALDYKKCFDKIAPYVDYIVLNISSPNTPNLRRLQNKSELHSLLTQVQKLNKQKYNKPILIKISPDLSIAQIDEILGLIRKFDISGIIATNTSSNRQGLQTSSQVVEKKGVGGLSGKPLYLKSKKIVNYIHTQTQGDLPIIAVGGIMSADDAVAMLNAGASLVQIYSGFVYNGPSIVSEINTKILRH